MSLVLDQITRKKLILVKQLYHTAAAQSTARYSAVSRILAVIGLDLAVETALKTVVSVLDARQQPDKTFGALIQQANDKLEKAGYPPLPDEANIRHVHSIRNDAQHKARYPTESDAVDCRIYVRDFLEKLVNQLWAISFEDISLVDLVQDARTREFLSKAEEVLVRGNYKEAVRQAHTGLMWATVCVRRKLFRGYVNLLEDFDFMDYENIIDGQTAEAIQEAFAPIREEISGELDSIRDTLFYAALGMNYAGLVRLRLIVPERIGFDQNGNPFYQESLFQQDVNEDEARFAFHYCLDAVLLIETQVGSIEAI